MMKKKKSIMSRELKIVNEMSDKEIRECGDTKKEYEREKEKKGRARGAIRYGDRDWRVEQHACLYASSLPRRPQLYHAEREREREREMERHGETGLISIVAVSNSHAAFRRR